MLSKTPITLGCDSKFSKVDKVEIPLSSSLALRIYSSPRPHNLLIANLQKGLILAKKRVEMVEEGTGFGVPVLLYSDQTYFSGSSHLYISQQDDFQVIRKEFLMDSLKKKSIGKIELTNQKLRAISKYLAELYREHRHIRPLMSTSLSRKLGVHDSFVKTMPVGRVVVTYGISQCGILVKVDFSHVKKRNLQKIVVLNEQGSNFFRRYIDSKNTSLVDEQIGVWEKIEAKWASIMDIQGKVGFRLWKTKNSILRRGRELMKGRIEWIGLDYEINSASDIFEYNIDILGV